MTRDVTVELKALRLHGMAGAWADLVEQGTNAGVDSSRWLIEHLLQAEGFFVVGHAVAFNQLDKVPLAVLRQCRADKVRVGRQIALGVDVQVSEVAPPAARDADFFGQFVAVVQHQHAPAALPGHAGAHQAGGAGAHHDYIIRLLCHPGPI